MFAIMVTISTEPHQDSIYVFRRTTRIEAANHAQLLVGLLSD